MDHLRFGTAGIPLSTPQRSILNGLPYLRKLALECMEIEFVRMVNISENTAPQVQLLAENNNIALTCHGQYYINLNSLESEKIQASKERIYKAAKIASLCGAKSMTFHAAYYMNTAPEKVFEIVKQGMKEVLKQLKDNSHEQIFLRPETTGKLSQWGDLKEILKLSQELEQVLPCIDFSHLHARSGGKENSLAEFRTILSQVETALGRRALDNMHIHLSGIEYTNKGERYHLNLQESDFKYQELLQAFKEFKIKGVVISESPNIEEDALLLKKEWESS